MLQICHIYQHKSSPHINAWALIHAMSNSRMNEIMQGANISLNNRFLAISIFLLVYGNYICQAGSCLTYCLVLNKNSLEAVKKGAAKQSRIKSILRHLK